MKKRIQKEKKNVQERERERERERDNEITTSALLYSSVTTIYAEVTWCGALDLYVSV